MKKRKHRFLVENYKMFLKDKRYARGTRSQRISIVQSFYNSLPEMNIDFGIPKNEVQYHNRDIEREDILRVLAQCCSRDRAIYSLIAQSGMSPKNVTLLQWRHIKEDFNREEGEPYCILLPKEISKGSHRNHFSFYGEETKRYLKAYFDVRGIPANNEEYVFLPNRKDNRNKEGRLSKKAISLVFGDIVRELGLISEEENAKRKGKPRTIRLYNLRKLFRKQAGLAGADYVNFWMGHSANYRAEYIPTSDEHYFSNTDIEFHRKIYKEKALPNLRLSKMDSRIESLEERLAKREAKIKDLESKIPTQEDIDKMITRRIQNAFKNLNNADMEKLKDVKIEDKVVIEF